MNKFILYWLDGKKDVIEGVDIATACNNAGIGNGALPALDFYEQSDIPTYTFCNGNWQKNAN